MKSYRSRRHQWVAKNSYFRHAWRFYASIGTILLGLVIALVRHVQSPLEASFTLACGLGCYLLLWGGECVTKWAWLAPEALQEEDTQALESAQELQRHAEEVLKWQADQTQHFQNAYLQAFSERNQLMQDLDSLTKQVDRETKAKEMAHEAEIRSLTERLTEAATEIASHQSESSRLAIMQSFIDQANLAWQSLSPTDTKWAAIKVGRSYPTSDFADDFLNRAGATWSYGDYHTLYTRCHENRK